MADVTEVSPTVTEVPVTVPSVVGDLPAAITRPSGEETTQLPGIVLVDGSGPGDVDDWGGWPEWITTCGAAVLRHAKPGSSAPGDWRNQTLVDRAEETLSAVEVLRATPGVDSRRVGLVGFSQGGWVAPLAASMAPQRIAFLIHISGPAVGVVQTERYRLRRAASDNGFEVAPVLDFYEQVTALLLAGDIDGAVSVAQGVANEPWYPLLEGLYESTEIVGFLAGILAHDPTSDLEALRCPLLAFFGADDTLVPISESIIALAPLMRRDPSSGVFVFPHANHGIFVADPDPLVDRRSQLAPGLLAIIEGFLESWRPVGQGLLADPGWA